MDVDPGCRHAEKIHGRAHPVAAEGPGWRYGRLAAIADEAAVPFKPFLDCAGSQAFYLYFLKSSGADKAQEVRESEGRIQFSLQIAESLSERTLRKEFLEASEGEKQQAEKVIKEGGNEAYLAYDNDRRKECASLVKEHQEEIMKAADKLYEDQKKR